MSHGMLALGTRRMPVVSPSPNLGHPSIRNGNGNGHGNGHGNGGVQCARGRVAALTAGDCRLVDEFELIRRCFRERATRRPGTVLGIGDDAALLDTGGLPLVHARATAPFRNDDDAAGIACHVFGAAFIRLATRAVTPRWATLGLTLEAGDPAWLESCSAATQAVCDAGGVELIGGDTTRGPGRATVFALGTKNALPRRTVPPPSTAEVRVRLSLVTTNTPERAIANLVTVCTDLAVRGAEIRCDDVQHPSDDPGACALELVANLDAPGVDALRAVAGPLAS